MLGDERSELPLDTIDHILWRRRARGNADRARAHDPFGSNIRLRLDVVQLHGDPDARTIEDLRRLWNGQVWAVQRVEGSTIPSSALDLFDAADAVVLDARVPGKLGGTGVALDWKALRQKIESYRARRARLVLAGGLRPENVSSAVDALHPDVVDVSSGVESRIGVKDHDRMRAFRDAVHAVHAR